MGIISRALVMALLLMMFSCSLFKTGYIDGNQQYVPKTPRFKLKDKKNNIIPYNLDTTNIYKLYRTDYRGKVHPSIDDKYSELNKRKSYLKFYSNGRVLSFSTPFKGDFGDERLLEEGDLNPNNPYYSKEYYYSNDGKVIKIEDFVYGEGFGSYIIFDYYISSSGDTLTNFYKDTKEVYIREAIPKNWQKYSPDW